MSENTASHLRRQLAQTPHGPGRSHGYPAQLRADIVAFLLAERARGVSLSSLARSLGASRSLLARWLQLSAPALSAEPTLPAEPAPFRAVTLAPSRGFTVHGPAGLRLEDLSLDAVVQLWRSLA